MKAGSSAALWSVPSSRQRVDRSPSALALGIPFGRSRRHFLRSWSSRGSAGRSTEMLWPDFERELYMQDCESGTAFSPRTGPYYRLLRIGAMVVRPKFTAGSAVIVTHEDHVLLLQEQWRDRELWGLPGGFQRRGERTVDTAVRELEEETQIVVDPSELRLISRCKQPFAKHYESLYHYEAIGDRPTVVVARREIHDFRWWDTRDLHSLTLPSQHAIFAHWRPGDE